MAADLITLERLLDAEGKVMADLEDFEVRNYEAAIRGASAAVRAYTDRDFLLNESGLATTRTFEYDESGYIDINDAQSVTTVRITFPFGGLPQSLTTGQWQALPYDGPMKDNIIIYSPLAYGMSREMGFTWNYDTYDPVGGPPPVVEVTAVWGWTAIPEDVQQATTWTASAFSEDARSVTSESIEGYSRSVTSQSPTAIPLRARDLLDQYRRIAV